MLPGSRQEILRGNDLGVYGMKSVEKRQRRAELDPIKY